jgi:hypothetical protein
MLNEKGIDLSKTLITPRKNRTDRAPLSYGQRRLWFIDQLQPNSSVYNMPAAYRFRGFLDLAALSRAISHIVARHEVLRTTFTTVDSEPLQLINPAAPLDLPLIDISQISEAA